ncbi:MAG: Wzy polymerase domain-containing protein [Burkholderiaceae bacterium]|nr:Wzy polymerase domain-containing protein [Burkholderiaceae bacterium]
MSASKLFSRVPGPWSGGPSPRMWLVFGALMLAVAWLLTNHHPPWTTFHSDALAACVLTLAAVVCLVRSPASAPWHGMSCLAALLVPLPLIQFAFGLIPFAGDAWICTAYLLGFLLALLIAAREEPLHPDLLADGLFLAVAVAAVVSVGLQLYQWMGLTQDDTVFDIWVHNSTGDRPYANMGQPNQLATLLLWGMLGCAWGWLRGKLGGAVTALVLAYLLIGLALTQSRTAWLALSMMLLAAVVWRRMWPSRAAPWVLAGLIVWFLIASFSVGPLSHWLLLDVQTSVAGRTHWQVRPQVWALFVEAALERPWWGYGWNQVPAAFGALILNYPELAGLRFAHAHNLFLDLVLWCGLPIGVLVSAALLWWLASSARRVRDGRQALLLLLVLAAGNHAMLELPLHYAYFLLPVGLAVGMLNARQGRRVLAWSGRRVLAGLVLVSTVLVALVINDYFRLEASFFTLRLEKARIGKLPPGQAPDVVLLTQLRELIVFARYEPATGVDEAALQRMRDVTNIYPTLPNLVKLSTVLALNRHPQEAVLNQRRLCALLSPGECATGKVMWKEAQKAHPALASMVWPE